MNLYLLTQNVNNKYDTYDSVVVAAENEEEARLINPDVSGWDNSPYSAWVFAPDQVKVELIGKAVPGTLSGIVLSSFNAG